MGGRCRYPSVKSPPRFGAISGVRKGLSVLLPGLPKMPRIYQRRVGARKYKDYTDESLREAVTTMKQKNLTLREASARFGIPKSSLSNALNGKHCVEKLGEIWYLISKKRNCSSPI